MTRKVLRGILIYGVEDWNVCRPIITLELKRCVVRQKREGKAHFIVGLSLGINGNLIYPSSLRAA